MVRLVQGLVHKRMMQASVNPVDAEVGEEDEERKLDHVVPGEGGLGWQVVQFRITTHFGKHAHGSQKRHQWHGPVRLADLQPDLVLEILGVVFGRLVENEVIGQSSAQEVQNQSKEPVLQSACRT